MFINNDEIQLDVAIKNAALFMMPSGNTAHANVAIKAKCSSVNMPAKFISRRFLWSVSFQASDVSVYKNGKKTNMAKPIDETLHL